MLLVSVFSVGVYVLIFDKKIDERQEVIDIYTEDKILEKPEKEVITEINKEKDFISQEDAKQTFQQSDENIFGGYYREDIPVEEHVLRIREKYNQIVSNISSGTYVEEQIQDGMTGYYDGDNQLIAAVISKETNGTEYVQSYYYEEGELIFAYYENEDSHRFYFHENNLIRWRYCIDADNPSEAVNYEKDTISVHDVLYREYITWENTVLKKAEEIN